MSEAYLQGCKILEGKKNTGILLLLSTNLGTEEMLNFVAIQLGSTFYNMN